MAWLPSLAHHEAVEHGLGPSHQRGSACEPEVPFVFPRLKVAASKSGCPARPPVTVVWAQCPCAIAAAGVAPAPSAGLSAKAASIPTTMKAAPNSNAAE